MEEGPWAEATPQMTTDRANTARIHTHTTDTLGHLLTHMHARTSHTLMHTQPHVHRTCTRLHTYTKRSHMCIQHAAHMHPCTHRHTHAHM